MESSQLLGGSEKFSSSESGWTSYFLSPAPSNDKSDDDHDGNNKYKCHDNSDDSLASDASSGPSHLDQAYGNGESLRFKQGEQESTSKYSSYKKANKQKEKKTDATRSTKVDFSYDYNGVLNAGNVVTPAQSRTTVRKSNRKSK